jgi:glycosyltransferase involved in cell wall biosynthesis
MRSVMKQDYEPKHLFVIDDQSTDATLSEMQKVQAEYPAQVTILTGTDLPSDWLGKNWACWQLVTAAKDYDMFLFLDADVELKANVLASSIEHFQVNEIGLMSGLPQQITKTLGEAVTVPIFYWTMYSYYPLILINKTRSLLFSAAIGQFILIDSKLYFELGGHEKLKHMVIEDLALAKLVKYNGAKLEFLNLSNIIKVRMYRDFFNAFRGLSKNTFQVVPGGIPVFFLNSASIILLLILPWFLIFQYPIFLIIVVLQIIQMSLISISQKLSPLVVIGTPIRHMVYIAVGFNSLIAYYRGSYTWKKRVVSMKNEHPV